VLGWRERGRAGGVSGGRHHGVGGGGEGGRQVAQVAVTAVEMHVTAADDVVEAVV